MANSVSIAAAQTEHTTFNKTILGLEKALPEGWIVAERQSDSLPYGHHFCDEDKGLKGVKVILVGPTPVQVIWTSLSGEANATSIAMESLELWFMPPEYRDSRMAWLCFHRPIQPTAILVGQFVSIFGRPSHRLNSKTVLSKLLTKAKAISWSQSPANDRTQITWSNWEDDIRMAVQHMLPN